MQVKVRYRRLAFADMAENNCLVVDEMADHGVEERFPGSDEFSVVIVQRGQQSVKLMRKEKPGVSDPLLHQLIGLVVVTETTEPAFVALLQLIIPVLQFCLSG